MIFGEELNRRDEPSIVDDALLLLPILLGFSVYLPSNKDLPVLLVLIRGLFLFTFQVVASDDGTTEEDEARSTPAVKRKT